MSPEYVAQAIGLFCLPCQPFGSSSQNGHDHENSCVCSPAGFTSSNWEREIVATWLPEIRRLTGVGTRVLPELSEASLKVSRGRQEKKKEINFSAV